MSETLLTKIKRTNRLPSPPGTAIRILELCRQDDVKIGELADVIAADPALSLRMLKYANSAMVGAAKEVRSIREAVLLLGLRSVRLMALSFSLISPDDANECDGFDFGLFWSHSAARAVAARRIAERFPPPPASEEAFATGLLSQIGRLVFAVALPREYADVIRQSGGMLTQISDRETERMGAPHPEVGADLMHEWGVPAPLAEAVRHQYRPDNANDQAIQRAAKLVRASTLVASLICYNLNEELGAAYRKELVASDFFESSEQLELELKMIREEFNELARLLSLRTGSVDNAAEIQAEAGEVLEQISLATQLRADEVEEKNKDLEKQAWTDGLTGIANRAAFDQKLQEIWDACCQQTKPIALIMLDVDHFKRFNDTYGHQTGDVVLKRVARCVAESVRPVDLAARYGGEEFAVIAPHADRLTAAHLCVRLRTAIEAARVHFEGKDHRVTVSVGAVLVVAPRPPLTPARLIEEADRQLYCSKEKGRNACSMKQLASPRREPVAAVI